MKKEIIKCDFCDTELNRDNDSHYYRIIYSSMEGWAYFIRSMKDFETGKEMCVKCAEVRGIPWR